MYNSNIPIHGNDNRPIQKNVSYSVASSRVSQSPQLSPRSVNSILERSQNIQKSPESYRLNSPSKYMASFTNYQGQQAETFLPADGTQISKQGQESGSSLFANLSQSQLNYLKSQNILEKIMTAVVKTANEQPDDALMGITDNIKSDQNKTGQSSILGQWIKCNPNVKVVAGPIVGEVTKNSAIIQLEAESSEEEEFDVELIVLLFNKYNQTVRVRCKNDEPSCVEIKNLFPKSNYSVIFQGVTKYDAKSRIANFFTKETIVKKFKMIALSCDRPQRILYGEKNPWDNIKAYGNTIDCILHLGDQIYIAGDDVDDLADELKKTKKCSPKQLGQIENTFQAKYRYNYNSQSKKEVLSSCSNLMIWSDNDIANDFDTLKDSKGGAAYHQEYISTGVAQYQKYQRSLWDTNYKEVIGKDIEEWHFHQYDKIGVFMIDMKGNRVTKEGTQLENNDFMSERQVNAFREALEIPEIKVMIVGAEIPFVGEPADEIQQKAEKFEFLKSHWPYRLPELITLLDLLFNWKLQGDREVVMIGGDIHCGVTSTIYDKSTQQSFPHLTTSPITNHVCGFFPKAEGMISERYTYRHQKLGMDRNYAEIDIDFTDRTRVDARLVAVHDE